MQALSLDKFKAKIGEEALIVDTRPWSLFVNGFIPGSISLQLEKALTTWVPVFLTSTENIMLITEKGKEQESLKALQNAHFTDVLGYLDGGYEAWKAAGEETDLVITIDPDELMMDIPFDNNLLVVDVRKASEFAEGHLNDAMNLPLHEMADIAQIANFEDHQNLYLHCSDDYRSVIAASLLKRQGYHNLRHINGGWNEIVKEEKAEIVKEGKALN